MSTVYAAEQAIIERIKDQVPGLADVGTVAQWLVYESNGQVPSPSVYVQPGEARFSGTPEDYNLQEDQEWLVVLCLDHHADLAQDDYLTSTKTAGELLFQIQRALIGWRPAQGWKTLTQLARPEPYFRPGYAEFPALFSTGQPITGIGV